MVATGEMAVNSYEYQNAIHIISEIWDLVRSNDKALLWLYNVFPVSCIILHETYLS